MQVLLKLPGAIWASILQTKTNLTFPHHQDTINNHSNTKQPTKEKPRQGHGNQLPNTHKPQIYGATKVSTNPAQGLTTPRPTTPHQQYKSQARTSRPKLSLPAQICGATQFNNQAIAAQRDSFRSVFPRT